MVKTVTPVEYPWRELDLMCVVDYCTVASIPFNRATGHDILQTSM